MKIPVDILEEGKIDHGQEYRDLWTRERCSGPIDLTCCDESYKILNDVLYEALERAAYGKGKQRHALGNEKFEDQQIFRATRFYGLGGLYFQAEKKLRESYNLTGEAKVKELLDVVVYVAAAIIYSREKSQSNEEPTEN